MKVLVTGGAGFIGSHVVDALIARGDQVVIVDRQLSQRKRFTNPKATVYKINLGDEEFNEVFLKEKPDAVCHLAAHISVPGSVADPIHDAMENIIHPLKFLKYSKDVGCKKIVFASSGGAIYGDHPVLPTPEVFDSLPISPYGVSKQAFERFLAGFHKTDGLAYTSLRFSNIYGPRQALLGGGEGGVVPVFITQVLKGEDVEIFGDGTATRDYLYVLDATDAFLKALDSDFVGSVNISTGKEVSLTRFTDLLKGLHGDFNVRVGDERPGDIKRSALLPNRAKEAIGWSASTTFEEGLTKTYTWFKEQQTT